MIYSTRRIRLSIKGHSLAHASLQPSSKVLHLSLPPLLVSGNEIDDRQPDATFLELDRARAMPGFCYSSSLVTSFSVSKYPDMTWPS